MEPKIALAKYDLGFEIISTIYNVMMTSKSLRNWPAPQFFKAEEQNKMDQDQKNRLTPKCEEKKIEAKKKSYQN